MTGRIFRFGGSSARTLDTEISARAPSSGFSDSTSSEIGPSGYGFLVSPPGKTRV